MAKDDKDSAFEEATRFDPQRSLHVAASHEKPVRVIANEGLVRTAVDDMSEYDADTSPIADRPPETLNPDDFTPIPPSDDLDTSETVKGPIYLDDELLGSHSLRVKLSPEDVAFLKAPTTLNPKLVLPRKPSSKPGSSPPSSRTGADSKAPRIRVERASSSPKRATTAQPRDANRFLKEHKLRSEIIRSDSADPKLIEGSRLGNYEIVRKVGQGGMGVVYEGRHLLLPRRVAIKFLLTEQGHNEEQIRRFLGEAVAAAQIGHKGVVNIYDYGYDNNNSAYLVMDYVDGQELHHIMKRSGQLPEPMALRIVRDVADVLAAAHQSGIVHRDLKPENIVLARDEGGKDYVKVLDFGVAKFVNAQSMSGKTQAGSILGTPWYMPPEQCQGFLTVDFRSDIYALGCVFYQMVCGKVPFAGSLRDVLMAHIHASPPAPRSLNPSISPAIERLILHMMAKDPADRPSSMESVSQVLSDFITPSPSRLRENRSSIAPAPHMARRSLSAYLVPALAAIIAGASTAAAFYFLQ